ncbi:MAG TPA: hypothetical protein VIG70_07220 [Burkholderiales bacterium]|jgi:hypothetical protein
MSPLSPLSLDTTAYGTNSVSKNLRAASSSADGRLFARSQTLLNRAQPAMNARKLGSSCARLQPGRSAKPRASYRAVSGCGFGGGQTGHFTGAGAHAATIRIKTAQRMWIIYLEIIVVLALVALIVWFTWPKKP